MSEPEGTEATAATGVPRDTTPTWEMELLLSGATVFGLLQLPRAIDELFFDVFNRLQEEPATIVMTLWVYAQASVLTIIVTFIAHLAVRGYWIALVGLGSVYRGGIRWDRLRTGPHLRAVNEATAPTMAARIEAADNRATRVFGVGMGLALAILVPMALVVVSLLLYLVVVGLGGAPVHGMRAFWGFFGLGFAPFMVLFFVDRWFGSRLDADRPAGRWLRRALAVYQRFGVGRASNPLLALFQSNEGARKTGVLVFLAILLCTGVTMVRFSWQASGGGWGHFPGLPEDEPRAEDVVLADHYATTRGRDPTPQRLPFIQDRVVKGPYVELFVPYAQRRHPRALAEACPAALAAVERGGPARATLDCLAGILDVRLDGAPLAVRLDAATDPLTGQRGVLALIRVEGLEPGRHELTLRLPPRRPPEPDDPPERPLHIPFWR
jgi:hypothetical protein